MINKLHLGNKEVLVIALSFGAAFGIPSQDALVESLPSILRGIFSLSVATGGLTAVIMNLVYLRGSSIEKEETAPTAQV